ncbi:unnamed protein product [Lupinus luteus]|uniref:Uncharacterized protein n=1 Tax=Lupinus luteus TaxID=3873 RepID=A0AAV1X138_LUPLU
MDGVSSPISALVCYCMVGLLEQRHYCKLKNRIESCECMVGPEPEMRDLVQRAADSAGKAAHQKGLARQTSGSFANEVQNQQGFVERRECTTGAQPHFFVRNEGEIEWSYSRSSRQSNKKQLLYGLLVLRHYGFGVDPGKKEGIHKNVGSDTMIKYYPHD